MYEVTMPKLSDSMEEGKIIEWKVKEGDSVSEGDVLAEVESDKAVMELECFQGGVVEKIMRGDGEEVGVGEVIATILEGEAKAEPTEEKEQETAKAEEGKGEQEHPPSLKLRRTGEHENEQEVKASGQG